VCYVSATGQGELSALERGMHALRSGTERNDGIRFAMNGPHKQNPTPNDQEQPAHRDLRKIKSSIDALRNQIKSRDKEAKKDGRWSKRTAIAAVTYTAFTFIIIVVAGYQAYLVRQTLIATQRAWIAMTGIWHDESIAFAQDAAINYAIEFHNIGKEPATRLAWRVANGIRDVPNQRLDHQQNGF
jgi:hypothetical protein